MICLTLKQISEIFGVPLWSPSSPNLWPDDYAIWGGAWENKTNATSHPNIGSLKTAMEEEWKKYLKNLTWKRANRFEGMVIQYDWKKKLTPILSKLTVLYLSSYFIVYFLKLKLILFYNRVAYYCTRVWQIWLLHPGRGNSFYAFGFC